MSGKALFGNIIRLLQADSPRLHSFSKKQTVQLPSVEMAPRLASLTELRTGKVRTVERIWRIAAELNDRSSCHQPEQICFQAF